MSASVGVATAKRAPSGVCPAGGGDRAAGFRFCGIPLRGLETKRAASLRCVAAAKADAFRDLPRRRRGSELRGLETIEAAAWGSGRLG